MKLAVPTLCALAAPAALAASSNCPNANNLTVQTLTGTYTGLIDPKYPNTRQFRAIPFAEPPALSRRWLPPQKLTSPPTEHHDATQFPPSCPQFVSAVPAIWNSPLTNGNLIYNGNQSGSSGLVGEATSEDCLYLAVWAPKGASPDAGLPVLFFMTGGGLEIGGVNIPWQFPTMWVERSQSHIVVTINYRVSIFGFPHARGLASGEQNLGILDQRAALEWVRDNIAAFGGDPKRIVQWGQSSGSISADIHAYAYHEDPIAQGYYMQSGVAINLDPQSDPTYSNFSFVARTMGCGAPCGSDDADGEAELECMRRIPFGQIVNFVGQYADAGTQPAMSFVEKADGHLVFANYTARAEAGQVARRPVIISNTANEWSSLVPWPVSNLSAGPYQPYVTSLDVNSAACPTFNATVYRNQLGPGVPVFRIQYAGTFPNLNYYKWLGAYHASDLPIIFGTYDLLDGVANTTNFEVQVSESMQDHILAFAQDPYRGPQERMGWYPMVALNDTNGGGVLRFGADGKVVQYVHGVEIDGVCRGKGEYDPFP